MTTGERNWAGNYEFTATEVHRPTSLEELRGIVARAPKIRAAGSCHSFNDIADGTEMITVEHLDSPIRIDRDAGTVTVGAGVRYGELARALERAGQALHNMASLPHISVGGAVATATHGSGDKLGNLATAVEAIELVTSDGDVHQVGREDEDFAGMVVGLGALGVVTRLTLDVQPTYLMRQAIYEHLSWDVFLDRFDSVMSAADSVSIFTDYGDDIDELWMKWRVDSDDSEPIPEEMFGATVSKIMLHPVPSLPADNCNVQLGVPGSWADRLPHFRMDAVPASGNEIQSEYMVPRKHAVAALQAVRAVAAEIRPHLWTSEIRTVAADDLWMSTAYETDTVCIHFSWRFDPLAVERLVPIVEAALEPFRPRPHWGKIFVATASDLEDRYERLPDFRRLVERTDPRGALRNAFLNRHVFGSANLDDPV